MDLVTGIVFSGIAKDVYEKRGVILSKLTSRARDQWEKFKIDSDIAFDLYLKSSFEKYSKIKTLLYRTQPKYIYDFFEYPNLISYDGRMIPSEDVDNLLDISHFLIVQGSGGIGKSTFMKHLFINELQKKDLIPIFLELKDLNEINDDYNMADFVFSKLYSLSVGFDKGYLEYALRSGCFMFILDGYDEIISDKKEKFLRKITDFCDRYSENYYIISSRPYSDFVEFQRFSVLKLDSFSKKQAISLISRIEYDDAIKNRFIKALDEKLYDNHGSFASNPLLLNIMLLTFDNYAEIPEKLHLFYAYAFEALYSKHDATKGGYKREMKSKLSFDEFKKVFSRFCFISYYHGTIEFSYDELTSFLDKAKKSNSIDFDTADMIDDLINSICLIYKDGLNYRFAHRSFQEYFSAVFLKSLSDDGMNKMALQLIEKDTHRASNDNVFFMLFDINQERVEQSILLPVMKIIEEDCFGDKYDFYFDKYRIGICYTMIPDSDRPVLLLRSGFDRGLIDFAGAFAHYYYDNSYNKQKLKIADDKVFSYLTENKEYKEDDELEGYEIKKDSELYEMFKETWVGNMIKTLASMRCRLSEKKTQTELDLDELLE